MSREVKEAYGEIQRGVQSLGKSIGEIKRGLSRAERQIAADARARIRQLRADARTEMSTLKEKQREVARSLKPLSAAAGDAWQDVKRSADAILAEARSTAASVIERFRGALGR